MTEPEGGRFEFDDGGIYCGGWAEGKAHGFGVCTAPKRQGDFAGEWNLGFEVSGVYTWPNGNTYEGQWSGGRRSGLGVETKGRWIYRGEWTQGFKGRYGIRTSAASGARYEGTWTTGVQDGYGMETYADGGTYRGQWKEGMRHGYGVRQSAPYNLAAQYRKKTGSTGLDSLDMKDSTKDSEYSSAADFLARLNQTSITANNRGGFALKPSRSGTLDQRSNRGGSVPPTPSSGTSPVLRRRNPSEFPQRSSLRVRIANTLKLKPSNYRSRSHDERGVLSSKSATLGTAPPLRRINASSSSTISNSNGYYGTVEGTATVGSMRSTASLDSDHSILTDNTDTSFISQDGLLEDSSVVETYAGEWKYDKRSGYGVSERSDGVKYEGEWFNNKMNGYGVTTLPDGSKEEGKYRDNALLIPTGISKAALMLPTRSAKQRHRIEEAVTRAIRAAHEAMQRTEITLQRVIMARSKAKSAESLSTQAKSDADLAHKAAKLFENIPLRIDNKTGEVDNSSGHSSNERLDGEIRRADYSGGKDGPAPKRTRSFIARVFSAGKGDKKTRPTVIDRSKLKSAGSDDPLMGEVGSVSRQNSRSRYVRKERSGTQDSRIEAENSSSYEQKRTPSPNRIRELLIAASNSKQLATDASTTINGYETQTNGFDHARLSHVENGHLPTAVDYRSKVHNNHENNINNGTSQNDNQYISVDRAECKCQRSLCVCVSHSRDDSSANTALYSDVVQNSTAPYTYTESQNYYSGAREQSQSNSGSSQVDSRGLAGSRLQPYSYKGNDQYIDPQYEDNQMASKEIVNGTTSSGIYPTDAWLNQAQGATGSNNIVHSIESRITQRRRTSLQPDVTLLDVPKPNLTSLEVPKSGPLTWQHLAALSHQRQEQLRKEREERNKSGVVIVFSVGVLREWIQKHQLLSFIIAFNIFLIFVFLKLIQ